MKCIYGHFAGHLPFEVVACHIFYASRLRCIFLVWADKTLVKDVLTCTPLAPSTYKSHHPEDTDDPDAVGGSSEDKAERLEEIPGEAHRLQKPPQPEPTSEPSPIPTPVPAEEEGVIRMQKRDLKRAQGILKDILAGRRSGLAVGPVVRMSPSECR